MSSVQIILIILFAICGLLQFNPPKSKKLNRSLFIAFYFALLLIVIFRSHDMADYDQYVDAFEGDGGIRFEPGFHLVKLIASLLGAPAFWGIAVFGFLSVSGRFLYLRQYKGYVWGMLLVYISNVLITQDMIAIRAAVASSLILFAIDFKFRGDWKKILIFLFCAVLFHYSAFAFIVLFIIDPHKHYRWLYILALIISHVLAYYNFNLNQYIGLFTSVNSIDVLYSMYENSNELNVFNLLQIGHVLVCCFLWIFIDRINKHDARALLFLKLYTIGLCTVPLLAGMIAIALRLSELFLTIEIMLIPIGFYAVFKSKVISRVAVLMFCAVIFYFTITNINYWAPLPKYF